MAEADFKSGLGFGLGEGGTRLSPPEDEDVEVGDADPAAIISFSSSIIGSPELMRSLKLGNVWVFVQLIFSLCWSMNQLYKNSNIAFLDFLSTLDIALQDRG